MALSEDGLVATAGSDAWHLVTGGEPMTEGRHYWEVEITKQVDPMKIFMVGAVRPGLDHDKYHHEGDGAYYIHAPDGSRFGNGKQDADPQGAFAEGDRVGVLLDLDAGWLRFYRNSKRCGPGFTEGVTGPLLRGVEVYKAGVKVTVLSGAVAPEGAGSADEPWEEPPAPEAESEADYYSGPEADWAPDY
jgi:hypothetical protein